MTDSQTIYHRERTTGAVQPLAVRSLKLPFAGEFCGGSIGVFLCGMIHFHKTFVCPLANCQNLNIICSLEKSNFMRSIEECIPSMIVVVVPMEFL